MNFNKLLLLAVLLLSMSSVSLAAKIPDEYIGRFASPGQECQMAHGSLIVTKTEISFYRVNVYRDKTTSVDEQRCGIYSLRQTDSGDELTLSCSTLHGIDKGTSKVTMSGLLTQTWKIFPDKIVIDGKHDFIKCE